MRYVLKNTKTSMYFAGYEPVWPCNKPTWTEHIAEAIPYDLELAVRMRRRLFCQSQFVEMVLPVD